MPANGQPDFFSIQIAEARRFHMEARPSKESLLAVRAGGCEHCATNYEIHRPSFPYIGIEFVAHGKGTAVLHGKTYSLAAGTIFSYGPGISQGITSDPQEPMVKYFLDFSGRHSKRLLERYGPGLGQALQTSAPGEVMAIWEEIIRTGLRATPFGARIVSVLLEYLLLKVAETTIPLGSSGTPAFSTYRRCRQWIENHALKLNSLDQMAAECHIDPAYLCRLFRRFDHQSPYQCLLKFKMNHAAQRLQIPGIAVKQVAEEVGFSDPCHFSRVFKKMEGLSPAQFARFCIRC
ncbi:MAG: AraC family transcriptional regulator [Verrucomicrobia bacterium]|nr:AraC family transcriptional regulator [Verrucomicrobiota bacterium]